MLEVFGFPLGTIFQGATLAAIVTAILTALGIWFRYGPDRTRAENEAKVIDNTEMARQYKEWRAEVHALKEEIAKCTARQFVNDKRHLQVEKMLTEAMVVSTARKEQMNNMMSLIELLIAELDRIDADSIIVSQAGLLLKQMRYTSNKSVDPFKGDPLKSEALNAAENTIEVAKDAVRSATSTRKEVVKKEESEE